MRRLARAGLALLLAGLVVFPGQAAGVVVGSPDLQVSLPEDTVTPGADTRLTLALTNDGDLEVGSSEDPSLDSQVTTARGVEATLRADGAPVEVETDTRHLGSLPRGERAKLGFDIAVGENATPGTYTLELTVEYDYTHRVSESSGVRAQQAETEVFDVTLEIDDRARFEIVSTESDLRVGNDGTIAVRMKNVGTESADAASVTLESRNTDLTFDGAATSSRFADDWAPGETRTLSYQLAAAPDARQQRYAFDATVTFEDEDGIDRQSAVMPLGVTPAPERAFALSNVSSTLEVGDEGTIRGRIANDGEAVARNVVVRLATESQQIEPVTRTYAVGTLAPGQAAAFEIDAEVTTAADAGPRQLAFVAEYRDADGDRQSSDELVTRQPVRPGGDVFALEAIDASYTPGSGGTLTVRVTNTAGEPLSAVSAKLFADDPVSADDKEAFVPELAPGESATVRFGVSVGGDALSKTYPVSVDLQYEDAHGDTHVSDSHRIAVRVTPAESGDGGGGLPLTLLGLGVLGVAGVGGYLRYRG